MVLGLLLSRRMKTTALAPQLPLASPPPAALSASPMPPTPKPSATGYPSADTIEPKAAPKKPSYAPAPTKAEVESGKAKLKLGQQGPAVGELQKKLGVVASGRFDAYIEPRLRFWDIAAGGLILECAGGEFWRRPVPGEETFEVIATNGRLRRQIQRHV